MQHFFSLSFLLCLFSLLPCTKAISYCLKACVPMSLFLALLLDVFCNYLPLHFGFILPSNQVQLGGRAPCPLSPGTHFFCIFTLYGCTIFDQFMSQHPPSGKILYTPLEGSPLSPLKLNCPF